mgnify:CR=1 FL=1
MSATLICGSVGFRLPIIGGLGFASTTVLLGVGHPLCGEVQSLSDMRRTDARSAEIESPDGVVRCFHVSVYKVEPNEAVLACNLFAKDDCRAALADEIVPDGPKVSGVVETCALSCGAEGLTGAGACPDGPVVWPSGKLEGVGPDADPGEEVALSEPSEVHRLNIAN